MGSDMAAGKCACVRLSACKHLGICIRMGLSAWAHARARALVLHESARAAAPVVCGEVR